VGDEACSRLPSCSCYKLHATAATRGLQRDVYLDLPIAPSYMSPNSGEGGDCGVPAHECNCTQETR
jgi:hypothetical protein